MEYCPSCYNARGRTYVKERGIANTDPAVLAEYGDGEWPLRWAYEKGEMAENGNYLENDEIAKRHGICGDPEQVRFFLYVCLCFLMIPWYNSPTSTVSIFLISSPLLSNV